MLAASGFQDEPAMDESTKEAAMARAKRAAQKLEKEAVH